MIGLYVFSERLILADAYHLDVVGRFSASPDLCGGAGTWHAVNYVHPSDQTSKSDPMTAEQRLHLTAVSIVIAVVKTANNGSSPPPSST
jgi:hypothetical protein